MIAQAAAAMGNGDVVMTLLKAGSLYGSALHFACAGGHAPIVQEIVEDGMRMDVRHNHPRKVEGEEVWHSSTSAASKDKGCTPRAPPPPPPSPGHNPSVRVYTLAGSSGFKASHRNWFWV